MIAIQIELLVERFHATAWGRAANEGEPEWPPSPWRLGRALVSAAWRSGLADSRAGEVDELLVALALPPAILLPRAIAAHTRHYMPLAQTPKPGKMETTTLVLDPFTRTDGDPIVFVWADQDLPRHLDDLLDELLSWVGYFGRADAPCQATRVAEQPEAGISAIPLSAAGDGDDGDVVQVLCLADDVCLGALSESTAERQKRRIASPACGHFVSYLLPRGALDPPRARAHKIAPRSVQVMRFAIESSAPVPIARAIQLADRYRAAVLKRADTAEPSTVALLRGRDEETGTLQGHRHCHYLVTDEDGDRRADHLTVWCPAGLDDEAVRALDVITLRSWAFDHPISLVLLGTGAFPAAPPPLQSAHVWASHTPFLPTRHPKQRNGKWVDGYVDQIRLELRRRDLPDPAQVDLIRDHHPAWGSFQRERDRRRDPAVPALGARLTFAQPITGPIALGRHSHFGMGLFLPEND